MSDFIVIYDQLRREAAQQDGCQKITGERHGRLAGLHVCGKPRVNAQFCAMHRFGV